MNDPAAIFLVGGLLLIVIGSLRIPSQLTELLRERRRERRERRPS